MLAHGPRFMTIFSSDFAGLAGASGTATMGATMGATMIGCRRWTECRLGGAAVLTAAFAAFTAALAAAMTAAMAATLTWRWGDIRAVFGVRAALVGCVGFAVVFGA